MCQSLLSLLQTVLALLLHQNLPPSLPATSDPICPQFLATTDCRSITQDSHSSKLWNNYQSPHFHPLEGLQPLSLGEWCCSGEGSPCPLKHQLPLEVALAVSVQPFACGYSHTHSHMTWTLHQASLPNQEKTLNCTLLFLSSSPIYTSHEGKC